MGVDPAADLQPQTRPRRLADDLRVGHVKIDRRAHLRFPLGRIERLGAALHDVGDAVELRRVPAVPERMQRLAPPAVEAMSVFGTTVKAQRVPVKPAVLEKLRNSIATSRAPGIS